MEVDKALKSGVAGEKEFSPWKEYVKAAMVALVLALFIRTFVVQAFKIPSESMMKTLLVGDHLLVNKLVYRFDKPQRGDIMVFEYPLDRSRDFVKRVIGLPGETLEMIHNTIYINGKPLVEPYTRYMSDGFGYHFGPVTIPDDNYFMMGDNRDNSQDSRVWGTLDKKDIIGKAFILHWSWKDNTFHVRWNRVMKLLK